MSQRIDKLRNAVNGLAIAGCLLLAVAKGLLALHIWEVRSPATAALQFIGMFFLLVAAVLIFKRIRAGAFVGMFASLSYQSQLMLSVGAHPLMAYIVLHIIVLWLNFAAWISAKSAGASN